MSAQYLLQFPHAAHYDAQHFMVSACNQTAWDWVHLWPNWPQQGLLLYGPQGSGKTHLSHIWQEKSSAARYTAQELPDAPAAGHVVIEAIEGLSSRQPVLFHWLNLVREHGGALLLTSRLAPGELPFTLPDLTSRIKALPTCSMERADDALMEQVLRKLCADRQLHMPEDVIRYLLPRAERSLAALQDWVEKLDQASLSHGRAVSIPLVRTLLNR